MSITTSNWKNKVGTGNRACRCGSWKQHWINFSGQSWPNSCSVKGCNNSPTLEGHVINVNVSGEKIIPMCDSCNQFSGPFDLKSGTTFVSANQSEACGK